MVGGVSCVVARCPSGGHFRARISNIMTFMRCHLSKSGLSVVRAVIPPTVKKEKVTTTLMGCTCSCTVRGNVGPSTAYDCTIA